MRQRHYEDDVPASSSDQDSKERLMEQTRVLLMHGRRLQDNITSNPSFKWAMIAIGCTLGVLLLVGLGFLIYYLTKKKDNKVQPEVASKAEDGQMPPPAPIIGQQIQPPPLGQPAQTAASQHQPVSSSQPLQPLGGEQSTPTPPWHQTGAMPPGIMLASQVPLNFQPYASNPRPAGAPPYERLLLISSRVNDPMRVAAAALPNVAVVVYDWKNFTFQELVRYIKKAIGTGKVTSLAVIAPGNKPGCVALLEGSTTTPEKLGEGGELLQFWRVLAGCVTTSGPTDGRRVDLLGCRVVEAPRDGAALLKELWARTAVPFAAADDALGGYMLATFLEDTATKTLSLIGSTIQGVDLYFNRDVLLGTQLSATATQGPPQAYSAPLPLGAPPIGALGSAAALSSQQLSPPLPEGDVFQRFTNQVAVLGYTLPEVYRKYDTDKSGQLTQKQVIMMLQAILPDASTMDVQHFQAMMDIDGNNLITLQEFLSTLQDNKGVHEKVKSGKDDNALMQQLGDYLTDNDAVLQEYFRQADKDKSGRLDHAELCSLVQSIPDLAPEEQKFIIGYIYQSDKNGDGLMTFDELKAVLATFGKKTAAATALQPAGPAPGAATALQPAGPAPGAASSAPQPAASSAVPALATMTASQPAAFSAPAPVAMAVPRQAASSVPKPAAAMQPAASSLPAAAAAAATTVPQQAAPSVPSPSMAPVLPAVPLAVVGPMRSLSTLPLPGSQPTQPLPGVQPLAPIPGR